MISISETEQQTLDIDWFFTNHEYIAFVASGGGILPKSVSQAPNSVLAEYFCSLPSVSEIIINPGLSKIIKSVDARYLEYFSEMSKKGLYSFDKTLLTDFSNTSYHLVAKPVIPLKFQQLPLEIRRILSHTAITGQIGNNLDVTLIS